MASIKEISQENYDIIYPNATAQTSVKVEHFIVEAKLRYPWEMFRLSREIKREDGSWEIPSSLWREAEIIIENNKADISSLNVFRSFDGDSWIGSIGGFDCDCSYMRLTVNLMKILCDDDYMGNSKPYYVEGKIIKFPKGTHSKTLPITYASDGTDVEDDLEIDDAIGALVSEYLYKKFSGKFVEDRTANSLVTP